MSTSTAAAAVADRKLGPRWSTKELRTFYILLKAYGQQWERLEERLPLRTNAMIRTLFEMHRGYLSLQEASVEGFCTIMMDHYKNLDELIRTPVSNQEPIDMAADAELEAEATTTAAAATGSTDATSISTADPRAPIAVVNVMPEHELAVRPLVVGRGREDAASHTRGKKKRKLDRFLAREEFPVDVSNPHPPQSRHPSGAEDNLSARSTSLHVKKTALAKQTTQHRHRVQFQAGSAPYLQPARLNLPWYYWFQGYEDADYFAQNEFVQCLDRMGLGKLTKAARPIWSSVRASMGRPRRLSVRFLEQEMDKLHTYLQSKRQAELATDFGNARLYVQPVAMAIGLNVMVRLDHPRRFTLGVIENFSRRDGVCKVRLESQGSRVCRLEAVMLLPNNTTATSNGHGASAPSRDRGTMAEEAMVSNRKRANMRREPPSPQATVIKSEGETTPSRALQWNRQLHDDKLSATLLVKDLLQRKEMLLTALGRMNQQARELSGGDRDERTGNGHVNGGERNGHGLVGPRFNAADTTVFQRQYAWVVVNLDITNRYLKAALLRLQDLVHADKVPIPEGADHTNASATASAVHDSVAQSPHSAMPLASNTMNPAMLTLEHMRWAVNFLAQTRAHSSDLVAMLSSSAIREPSDSDGDHSIMATTTSSSSPSSSLTDHALLPETKELVAHCVALASVIRCDASAVPPLITQKLGERLLELLEPRFDANRDLYAELRATTEGVTAMATTAFHGGNPTSQATSWHN